MMADLLPENDYVARIAGLTLSFPSQNGPAVIVDGVSLNFQKGRVLALVGQSGSGKSLFARSLVNLLPRGASCSAEAYEFAGRHFSGLPPARYAELRGVGIGYIFQEPLSTLNPALTIYAQMSEALKFHFKKTDKERRRDVAEALRAVELAEAEALFDKYPHQLSGGMRQRVMIASALLLKPALLVADEPTTALDPLLRQEVLRLLKKVSRDYEMSILFITHDIASMAGFADWLAVMRDGRIVEEGAFDAVLGAPQTDYARFLLDAAPSLHKAANNKAPRERGEIVVEAKDLDAVHLGKAKTLFGKHPSAPALRGVNLSIREGEFVGLIGASGAGKTTLARVLLGLHPVARGELKTPGGGAANRFQYIHQDAGGALDPMMRVGALVEEGLLAPPSRGSPAARREKVARTLELTGLDPALADRYPHELSGGQRQRVCIARAIVTEPRLIVADEPISALDLAIQKQIIELFRRLREELGFAGVFVTHDFNIVEELCDKVCVLNNGRIIEAGATAEILTRPVHEHTKRLIEARVTIEKTAGGGYRVRGK